MQRAAISTPGALEGTTRTGKGAEFLHYILCEVHPSTELIIRVGWSPSFSDPAGGRPGTTATRPLGEMGCFWTTFLEFDPSKLGYYVAAPAVAGTLCSAAS